MNDQATPGELAAALARIRGLLACALGRTSAPATRSPFHPIDTLARLFGLSPFEADVLLLCAGAELDTTIAADCSELHGDTRRAAPSFGIALSALPAPHWDALAPHRPLRHWQLIHPAPGELLTRAALRIDERVLHQITGAGGPDARLAGVVRPVGQLHTATAHLRASELAAATGALAYGALMLCNADLPGLLALACAAIRANGREPLLARATDLPATPAERHTLARLWHREALLGNVTLVLELDGDQHARASAAALLDEHDAPVVLLSETPISIGGARPVQRQMLNAPGTAEQHQIWQHALGSHAHTLNGSVPTLASQFRLPPAAIHAAAARALISPEPASLETRLWDACREQARPHLDDLAQRISTRRGWPDLVLPDRQRQMLHAITAHVAQRRTVYETWGFGEETRGTGTSVIFAGGSGTGKTLAAEILANELRLDLYRVDLSGVVSKYIGETEKNLRRIFTAAEHGGAILLFDEADALFGKRSEVRDSHDRYANIEVSYLLQQMESYRGLAILTTNLLDHIDRAFLRRVRFVVQFPFPGPTERAEIWRRAFPAAAPLSGVDVDKLARLNISGGNITTIALNAAFLAAQCGESIGMAHLRNAATSEFAKLERVLPDAEIRDWVPQ